MPIDRIITASIQDGAVIPADLSTGGPSWDTSGNVNVNAGRIRLGGGSDEGTQLNLWTTLGGDGTLAAFNIIFNTGANNSRVERARIDSSGNLLINTTSNAGFTGTKLHIQIPAFGGGIRTRVTNNGDWAMFFENASGTTVGRIQIDSGSTSYVTSSDYRLKENVQPMTGALSKVAALKPVIYTWKADGSAGEGFIAHELADVCPQAVSGEKDAVNEDGSIKPQGIDTSFLVATLTAAIQEQQQMIETLQAKVAALEAK